MDDHNEQAQRERLTLIDALIEDARKESGFCPDGYVWVREAVLRAARHCFPERLDAFEVAVARASATAR
jgi:hypothetical protein